MSSIDWQTVKEYQDITYKKCGGVARIAFNEVWGVVRLLWVLFLLAVLEAWSRVLGWYDFAVKRDRHVIWNMAWTQKQDVQSIRRQYEKPSI